MNKRVLGWIAALLLLAVTAFGIPFLLPQNHALTSEDIAQLRQGMCEREVRQILGPPGNYSSDPYCVFGPMPGASYVLAWVSDEMAVGVSFDDDGKVIAVVQAGGPGRPEGERTWLDSGRLLLGQIWPPTATTGRPLNSFRDGCNRQ